MEEPFALSTPASSAAVGTPASALHQPRASGALVQRHELGNAERHLWALGLDSRSEKPPLSYTTPGASLARLRLDLAEQYHRVCSSLGAHEGSFPPVDAGGRLLWPLPSDQHAHARHDLASIPGFPHMMLSPPPFLGAPSPLLYELDQPLAALQAIGHQPQFSDAVSNMLRHANGGALLGAGRRRGSRVRALPQNAPLFLTQGEGVGSPQLDEPQQGSILQEESSLVFPRSHKQSPGAIIHRAPPSSAMLSPGTRMPSIDTLSDFVYSRHDRQKDPPSVPAGPQQTGAGPQSSEPLDQIDHLLREWSKKGSLP